MLGVLRANCPVHARGGTRPLLTLCHSLPRGAPSPGGRILVYRRRTEAQLLARRQVLSSLSISRMTARPDRPLRSSLSKSSIRIAARTACLRFSSSGRGPRLSPRPVPPFDSAPFGSVRISVSAVGLDEAVSRRVDSRLRGCGGCRGEAGPFVAPHRRWRPCAETSRVAV